MIMIRRITPLVLGAAALGAFGTAGPLVVAGHTQARTSIADGPRPGIEPSVILRLRHAFEDQLGPVPTAATRGLRSSRLACDEFVGRAVAKAFVVESKNVAGRGYPDWCRVKLIVRASAERAETTVWIGLPRGGWNGRFLGIGGGGFMAGHPDLLETAVPSGFAAAVTDGGNPFSLSETPAQLMTDTSFLWSAGRVDHRAAETFGFRAIHDMTLIGKAATSAFYGVRPRYSYFSGCSNGGRQGLMEVQRYPQDYDGVLAGAPSLSFSRNFISLTSARLLVKRHPMALCKFGAANARIEQICDGQDGLVDGLASRLNCKIEPSDLVDFPTPCGPITSEDARVVLDLRAGQTAPDGRQLWHGPHGHDPVHPDPVRNALADAWMQLVLEDRQWSFPKPLPEDLGRLLNRSVERLSPSFDASNADLSGFYRAGGRLLIWHGLTDQIPADGVVHYVDAVRQRLGAANVDDFLRLYLAPGVDHCGAGSGPQPTGLLGALIDWVETGRGPGHLIARKVDAEGKVVRTRPLCPHPQAAAYRGKGSLDEATNFECGGESDVG